MNEIEGRIRSSFDGATAELRLPSDAATRAQRGARRTQRRRAAALGVALLVAAGGVTAGLSRPHPGPASTLTVVTGTPSPDATSPGTAGADAQAAPYWFIQKTRSSSTNTATGVKTTSVVIDSWLGHDNPYYYAIGSTAPFGDLIFDPKYTPGVYGTYIDWDEGWKLPTNVTLLRRHLFVATNNPDGTDTPAPGSRLDSRQLDADVFALITETLLPQPGPHAERLSLVKVAESLQDMTMSRGSDSLGRPATVLTEAAEGGNDKTVLFTDPATGTILQRDSYPPNSEALVPQGPSLYASSTTPTRPSSPHRPVRNHGRCRP